MVINQGFSHIHVPTFLIFQSSQKKRRRSDFIPYRDSVLTWLLKENLGTVPEVFSLLLFQSYIKN